MDYKSAAKAIDPNAAADPDAGIFGLPYLEAESKLVFVPVPWEATTSYGGGTAHGPQAILQASSQLDLFDLDVVDPYLQGLYCLPISDDIFELNTQAKKLAQPIKDVYGDLENHPHLKSNLTQVNSLSEKLNAWVKKETQALFSAGKIPGIIGGDHSVPFGAFQAAAETHGSFGILHIDAHSDTRKSYLGFDHSHASIMYNTATRISQVEKLVQIGIRDFCEEEYRFIQSQKNRFEVFFDQQIVDHRLQGNSFSKLAEKMIASLPERVWISFDIDGLDPRYCPHTGTPVPGGLDYSEAVLVLRLLAKSGRKIIGFDLNEVAPGLDQTGNPIDRIQASDEWDANVGMRLLYKLASLSLASQGFAKWRN